MKTLMILALVLGLAAPCVAADLYYHTSGIGPAPCPKNWRMVTRLDLLPDTLKAKIGWYPVANAPGHDPLYQIPVVESADIVDGQAVLTYQFLERPLVEVKLAKKDEILAAQQAAMDEGVVLSLGPRAPCDPDSVSALFNNYHGMLLSGATSSYVWDFNGIPRQVSAAAFKTVLIEVYAHVQALQLRAADRIQQIKDATTVAEVVSITWEE